MNLRYEALSSADLGAADPSGCASHCRFNGTGLPNRGGPRPGARFLKPLRQLIESVNDTLKGRLDLERHGGRTHQGLMTRMLQRLLALTAAIWHNHHSGQPRLRSLVAYDH